MGAYTRALLGHDVQEEGKEFQKKAKKKSLWGSIGRTIGGLGAMAISGGTLNPVTLGLLSGGMSFLGGAAGAAAGGKLTGDKFFQADRKSAQTELGAFGTQNITSSLKSGLAAGIGQATKLYKAGSRAKELGKSAEEVSKIRKGVGFGESFGESFAGKSKFAQNIKSAKYFKDQGLSEFVDPNLQVGTESGKKIIAMDRTDPNLAINKRLGMGTGKGADFGETNYLDQIGKTAIPSDKMIPTNTLKDTARSMFWDDPDMTLNPWEMKERHQTEQLMQNYGDWGKFNPETGENLQYERVVSGLRKSIGDY